MKFILTIIATFFMLTGVAMADYRLIIPSPHGTGTSIWGQVVAEELEKYLGERIIIEHIDGGKGNLGLEVFNTRYRDDPRAILLAHGGNANAWLIEDVNWTFYDWDPIVIQPYNITTTIRAGYDWQNETLNLADCSGCVPETLAWTMLIGWDNINFVRSMNASDAQQAWMRGDFNYIREPASRHISNTAPLVDQGLAVRLFNHGIFMPGDGFVADYNWPDTPTAVELYRQVHGRDPRGPVYEAYILSAVWRDGLQKGLFMHKGGESQRVLDAFREMMENEESRNYLIERLGDYPIFYGEESRAVMEDLYSYVTRERLQYLVDFARNNMRWSTAIFVEGKTVD
jgi:hypothetical protein